MRSRVRRVLVPLAVVAIAGMWTTGTASAKTITVKSGDSIQAAIDKAKVGDTISVAKGTYKENIEISQNELTLIGKNATIVPPEKPHEGSYCWGPKAGGKNGICVAPEDFDFENFAPREGIVAGVSVSGFTVKNFAGTGVMVLGGEDTKVSDNTVVNNKEYGVGVFASTRTVISGNSATAKKSEAGIYIGDSPDSQAEVSDNTSKGANDGIFLRNAENATFEGNTLTGNCAGVLILGDAPGPVGNSTFSGNTITKNNKFCPEGDTTFSGIGIAIASGTGVAVQGNTITDNKPSKEAVFTGGVVIVAPPPEEPGATPTPPSNNSVTGNTISGNEPDLSYDGSGTGNTFSGNTGCTTSQPEGLCA
jgi:parallel beta-helix repeat protein